MKNHKIVICIINRNALDLEEEKPNMIHCDKHAMMENLRRISRKMEIFHHQRLTERKKKPKNEVSEKKEK